MLTEKPSIENRVVETSAPTPQPVGKIRYNEIDLFRGLAVCLMAATHGLFWVMYRPLWTYAPSNTGIFFCYIIFLFTFGMSLAVVCRRGNLDATTGRVKILKRSGVTLLAYYTILGGHYLLTLLSTRNAHHVAATLLGYLIFLDVPKAGDFIVSFVLLQALAVLLGRRLRVCLDHPWLLMGFALVCQRLSMAVYAAPIPKSALPYWRLFFGSEHASRSFPILGYMPLFAASLLLGNSYLAASNRSVWLRRALAASLLIVALALPGDWLYARAAAGFLSMLDPVPTLFFLIDGGAMTTALFCLCGFYCLRAAYNPRSPVNVFLTYVGQNSIWIIVWQYTWIQVFSRLAPIPRFSSLPILPYIAAVTLLPPATLHLAQRLRRSRLFFMGASQGGSDRALPGV